MINTIIKGSFSVQVLRGGKVIKSLPRTNNLITRGGMEAMAEFGSLLHVGTGGTTPVFADTSLDSFLANSNVSTWTDNTDVLDGTDYTKESQNTFVFNIGAVVGNISELGVSTAVSEATDIQTRALFKDGVGDPTTITVTAQDQLIVTYFVQKTISMVPFVSSIVADLDGTPTTIDYTIRPCISSTANSGAEAKFPASIYQSSSIFGFYLTVNDANRISVNGVTFIPTLIDSDGQISDVGTNSVSLTATGNVVTHTMPMPVGKGNFQWVAATVSLSNSTALNVILFQIEFDGPNYINKTGLDAVVFKLKETMNQVIV